MATDLQPIQTSGVNDIFEYVEVHLTSALRDKGTNDQPLFTLRPALHSVLGFKVISAQLPSTAFNINAGNNTVTVRRTGTTTPPVTLTFSPGLYTPTPFTTTWTQSFGPTTLANEPNYVAPSLTYSTLVGRFILTNNSSFPLTFTFDPNVAAFLGAPATLDVAPGALTLPLAPLIAPTSFHLVSAALSMRVSEHVRVNGSTTPNPSALATIPNTANPYEIINYTDPTSGYFFDVGNHTLDTVDLALISSSTLAPVQLNGYPWSVTLAFLVQRDTSLARQFDFKHGHKRMRIQA